MKKLLLAPLALLIIPIAASTATSSSLLGDALAKQRAMGYNPCTPYIGFLPQSEQNQGVLADSDNGNESGVCFIRFGVFEDSLLTDVAWHEVCHLSTVQMIADSDQKDQYGPDWAHNAPYFKQCIRMGPPDPLGYGK